VVGFAIERARAGSDRGETLPLASSMSYDDLREHGSESAVKAAGKLRQVGRTYIGELAVPGPVVVSTATQFNSLDPPLLSQSNQGIAATGSVASRQAASV
jgi:hypothetical protein